MGDFGDPVVVVRVPRLDDRVMVDHQLRRRLLERALALVQDEDVIREEMDEAADNAALGKVDLLLVTWREGLVEGPGQVERWGAYEHAVAKRGGDDGVHPCPASADRARQLIQR